MKKEYVLIDKNNIIVDMIKINDKEKIKEKSIYNTNYKIEERKSYMYKGLNLCRVVNGVILSNKEAIDKGFIKLKENEVLINDDIVALKDTQKVVNGEIVDKSIEEKYIEGLIDGIEHNNYIRKEREKEYVKKTDELKQDLIENIFITLKEKGLLSEENIKQLETLLNEKNKIKENLQKVKEN